MLPPRDRGSRGRTADADVSTGFAVVTAGVGGVGGHRDSEVGTAGVTGVKHVTVCSVVGAELGDENE